MSIEHCDNWSIYGGNTGFMTNGVYASVGGWCSFTGDPDGISAGDVFHQSIIVTPGTSIAIGLRYILAASQEIVGIAERIWLDQIPANTDSHPIFAIFSDASNAQIGYAYVNTVGGFTAVVEGVAYSTPGPVISANAWWHVETKIDATGGTFEIRVEGVSVLLQSGLTLPETAQVALGFINQNGDLNTSIYHKDFVIWNGAGSQNIDFLGSVLVASLIPNADVALNWAPTPSSDAGHTILATVPPQDNTVFLDATNPPPAAYVGTLTGLSGDITSVKCIMTMVRAAKVDGGDGSLQVGLISSPAVAPATTLGADRSITVAQSYWRDVFEIDPKTEAEWLPSAVSVVQLQLDRTT